MKEDDESGLVFVDPEVERRAQIEREKLLKKKEMPMIKLKDGSLVPAAHFIPQVAASAPV